MFEHQPKIHCYPGLMGLFVRGEAGGRALNWVIFSTIDFAEEYVLRRRRASPLINPFLTPGGW